MIDLVKQAFIIGGTGQIGRAVGLKLLKEGWGVTFASRSGDIPDDALDFGAKAIVLDRDQAGALAQAVGGGADAVIDTVAYDEAHANQLLDIEGSIGQFVVISSSSVYRDEVGRTLDEAQEHGFPDLPDGMTEDQPTCRPRSEELLNKKGRTRKTVARRSQVPCHHPASRRNPRHPFHSSPRVVVCETHARRARSHPALF